VRHQPASATLPSLSLAKALYSVPEPSIPLGPVYGDITDLIGPNVPGLSDRSCLCRLRIIGLGLPEATRVI